MFYTRESYSGQTTKDTKRMHARGIFSFANGNKYVGTFHDGMFHGQGIIFFTKANGGGQFRGTWKDGECLGGDYIFADGLQFLEHDWGHCTEQDRRFWDEYLTFIKPPTVDGNDVKTVTPDYSTSDGVPPAFANGKPRGADDVTDDFWCGKETPKARPEHDEKAVVAGTGHDMAATIATACPRVHGA